MGKNYSISEASRLAGLSVSSARNYLQFGLLKDCGRTPSGRYILDDACVRRLRLIGAAMRAGLHLDDLRPFLHGLDQSDTVAITILRAELMGRIGDRHRAISEFKDSLKEACRKPSRYRTGGKSVDGILPEFVPREAKRTRNL